MSVAVWDTYITKKNGDAMHFDIIVPDTINEAATIYQYGKAYLKSKNEENASLESQECQLCHVESPTTEMLDSISQQGYFILEMEDISAALPPNPSRRDLIMHLRAFYKNYRFADFKGKTLEDVQGILNDAKK